MPITRREALARARRAIARRKTQLKKGRKKKAHNALEVARRYFRLAGSLRGREKPKAKITFTSAKRWFTRPWIKPNLIVLHDTESPAHSGYNTSSYLARGSVQADVHIVIDVDGTTYRLVPDGRKAWHVMSYNSRALGIEHIGYVTQAVSPAAQVEASARWVAYWSRKYNIPIRDARKDLSRGIVTHKSLGAAGGGHVDPWPGLFDKVVTRAKQLAAN